MEVHTTEQASGIRKRNETWMELESPNRRSPSERGRHPATALTRGAWDLAPRSPSADQARPGQARAKESRLGSGARGRSVWTGTSGAFGGVFFFSFNYSMNFIYIYRCTMIITSQFYSVSIPNPQWIPPPPACLTGKPEVFQSVRPYLFCREVHCALFYLFMYLFIFTQ